MGDFCGHYYLLLNLKQIVKPKLFFQRFRQKLSEKKIHIRRLETKEKKESENLSKIYLFP